MLSRKRHIILLSATVGAAVGPLVVLRDALVSSETDWSGQWWIVAALTAAAVCGLMGAMAGALLKLLMARLQPR